ncbi:hypothetical protein A11A3_04970 [Alcanivorax hongdengensis A-11-3]|uniref:Uncharacterized protein n=1 Tax=Alcanivorax hongdengensis A-11-3 TaxID=1177179 RepID=L0WF04_9GAMM|nr:hypothetical protein [Alcanivorax hongdengensis]EKF75304.1 hypothetical protein A11A3_04970 [Alcanivorax hongdengensis A-11-3]
MRETSGPRSTRPMVETGTAWALVAMLAGITMMTLDIRLQLVGMLAFFAGALATVVGFAWRALRYRPGAFADSLLLAVMAAIMLAQPLLPVGLQDTLEYLKP